MFVTAGVHPSVRSLKLVTREPIYRHLCSSRSTKPLSVITERVVTYNTKRSTTTKCLKKAELTRYYWGVYGARERGSVNRNPPNLHSQRGSNYNKWKWDAPWLQQCHPVVISHTDKKRVMFDIFLLRKMTVGRVCSCQKWGCGCVFVHVPDF